MQIYQNYCFVDSVWIEWDFEYMFEQKQLPLGSSKAVEVWQCLCNNVFGNTRKHQNIILKPGQ